MMEIGRALTISSPQNARVKRVIRLGKRRTREEQQQTVVEGIRESSRALACNVTPVEAFICPELLPPTPLAQSTVAHLAAFDRQGITVLYHVTADVFRRMAYRGDSGGILLVIPYRLHALDRFPITGSQFIALIEGVEKPGNLGAILRTADAAGVDGLFVCTSNDRTATDVHNPNVIRASLGAIFSVPIVETSTDSALAWLRQNRQRIVAATPDAVAPYTAVDMTGSIAVALGSEAHGLSMPLLRAAETRVHIPMYGMADSLNLATSAALMLYEAVRQRTETRTQRIERDE